MTTKVKGLLKGLRYISQIFDPNIKEPEMQIGFPTDVKHVAHIGWDGPSTNAPSWMNEYRSSPEFSSATLDADSLNNKSACQDLLRSGGQGSTAKDLPELPLPKPSRRKQSSSAPPPDSPTLESSNKPKQSKRHQSAGKSTETPKPSRRHQSSGEGVESPTKDPSGTSKNGRRRKSKGSSGSGSTRSSRSKDKSAAYSDPDVKNLEQNLALKSIEEEEERV
ncbi:CRIB domain-containing protein RIC10 [Magnolia sinica]|uniref:CRIB domain-containing protein RIC10 n=1 Tax=Magnolia sinica TaxID=86752 RepID=UPI0026580468|nr:CRIB domain-containing protein RIC10 [Magnolia sinica]